MNDDELFIHTRLHPHQLRQLPQAIELDCEGIAGPAGYETYSEYVCPSCRKLNRAKTPGRIISARPTELTTEVTGQEQRHYVNEWNDQAIG